MFIKPLLLKKFFIMGETIPTLEFDSMDQVDAYINHRALLSFTIVIKFI